MKQESKPGTITRCGSDLYRARQLAAVSLLLGGFLLVIPAPRHLVSEVGADEPVKFHLMPIRRLSPHEFRQLPRSIVRALESRGCTIPQTWLYDEPGDKLYRTPHNVIRGSFRGEGRTDWAILCSHRDSSVVVIFWAGKASDVSEFQRGSDEDWTQGVNGRGDLGYSRLLAVASPRRILSHNPDLRSRTKTHAFHDGIEDHFLEKASSIYYFENGHLLKFEGSD